MAGLVGKNRVPGVFHSGSFVLIQLWTPGQTPAGACRSVVEGTQARCPTLCNAHTCLLRASGGSPVTIQDFLLLQWFLLMTLCAPVSCGSSIHLSVSPVLGTAVFLVPPTPPLGIQEEEELTFQSVELFIYS